MPKTKRIALPFRGELHDQGGHITGKLPGILCIRGRSGEFITTTFKIAVCTAVTWNPLYLFLKDVVSVSLLTFDLTWWSKTYQYIGFREVHRQRGASSSIMHGGLLFWPVLRSLQISMLSPVTGSSMTSDYRYLRLRRDLCQSSIDSRCNISLTFRCPSYPHDKVRLSHFGARISVW